MTDDLDNLKAALKTVPAPDADAKTRALALAMENFDRLQGSTDPIRSSKDRPSEAAPLNGVRRMLTFLTTRPALAATTSIAALVIGVAVILPVADLRQRQPVIPTPDPARAEAEPTNSTTEAPVTDADAATEAGRAKDAAAASPMAEAEPAPDPIREDRATTDTEAKEAPAEFGALAEATPPASRIVAMSFLRKTKVGS